MGCDCNPTTGRVCVECEVRALQRQLQQAQEELKPYAVGPSGEPFFKTKADAERALEQVEREYDAAIAAGYRAAEEQGEIAAKLRERAERAEALVARVLADGQVRDIYAYLIDKSWESGDTFELYQEAWKVVAHILKVEGIDDNGHGKVRWVKVAEALAQRECLHTHDHRHSERDGLSHWYNDPALRPSVIQHSHEHSSTGHHEDSPHAEAQRGEGDEAA